MPNYKELETNLIDVVKEFQIKIGYSKDPIYLYYPLESLNSLLEENFDVEGMMDTLKTFADNNVISKSISCSHEGDRFCIIIPEEGVTYVYKNVPEPVFLKEFINVVQRHGNSLEDVTNVFKKYSPKIKVEEINNGEFDYMICFEEGNPDKYKYCIKFEGDHTIYHRFTDKDYRALIA